MVTFNGLFRATVAAVKTGVKDTAWALVFPKVAQAATFRTNFQSGVNSMKNGKTDQYYYNEQGELEYYNEKIGGFMQVLASPIYGKIAKTEAFFTETVPYLAKGTPIFEAAKAFKKEINE